MFNQAANKSPCSQNDNDTYSWRIWCRWCLFWLLRRETKQQQSDSTPVKKNFKNTTSTKQSNKTKYHADAACTPSRFFAAIGVFFTLQQPNVVTYTTRNATAIIHAERNTKEERLMDELEQTFFSKPTAESDEDSDQQEPLDDYSDFRCGFIGIVWALIMRKSTMLNESVRDHQTPANHPSFNSRDLHRSAPTFSTLLLRFPWVIDAPNYELHEGVMEAVKGALANSDVLLGVTVFFGSVIPDDAVYKGIKASRKSLRRREIYEKRRYSWKLTAIALSYFLKQRR